jgi:hypothetical protein
MKSDFFIDKSKQVALSAILDDLTKQLKKQRAEERTVR